MLSELTDIVRVLREAESHLAECGVPNARRNAEWLLGHVLGCRSPELYLTPYRMIDRRTRETFDAFVLRRCRREPLQYILGETEFMSLPFRVRPGVFIPRPDTEVLVETAEALLSRRSAAPAPRAGGEIAILDLCCGSGVIGVSLASRIPRARCVAVDIDPLAVALSRENAALNGVERRVTCVEADAVEFLRGRAVAYDAVVCNPPYVPTGDIEGLLPELRDYEPASGLDGGPDGLRFYRGLAPLLERAVAAGGIFALEIGDTQAEAVASTIDSPAFADVAVHKDYSGRDRVVTARRS